MRAESLTPAHVRRAVDLFVAQGFPPGARVAPRTTSALFHDDATLEQALQRMTKDDDGGQGARRFSLQLGNERYLFSKLLLCEYLIEGELFFAVETHDNLPLSPSNPEYPRWLEIKRHNRELKEQIETAWRAHELPTFRDLREVCEALAHVEREPAKERRILVVDDERDIALAVAALARGRGWEVDVAFDGAQVLERLAREPLPDLVLLDYELPDHDGGELCARMRGDPRLAKVPIVMATAARISLARLGPVSGFLRKPYPRSMLFSTLRNLLGGAERP